MTTTVAVVDEADVPISLPVPVLGRIAAPFLASAAIGVGVLVLAVAFGVVKGPLWQAFQQWDGGWYVYIAEHGYPPHVAPHDAFFPAYPLLIRLAAQGIHNYTVAALVVSLAAQLIALAVVAAWVRYERDEASARWAPWFLALFPFAFFLSGAYSESSFIAVTAGALYLSRRGHPWLAGLLGAVAGSFRLFGLAIIPALAIELWRARRYQQPVSWISAGLPALGVIGYAAYLQIHTGDALAFEHVEKLFAVQPAWPWQGALAALRAPANGYHLVPGLELLLGLCGVLLVSAAWLSPTFPRSMAAYCTAALLLMLSLTNWRSTGRYELALFPLVLLAVDWTRSHSGWRQLILTSGGIASAFGVLVFARGGWIG